MGGGVDWEWGEQALTQAVQQPFGSKGWMGSWLAVEGALSRHRQTPPKAVHHCCGWPDLEQAHGRDAHVVAEAGCGEGWVQVQPKLYHLLVLEVEGRGM